MKKIFLGLFIAIVASTSGMYVSANNKASFQKVWGNRNSFMYSLISYQNYNPANCIDTTDEPCAYRLIRFNGPEYVPDNLLTWQIDTWVDKGYLQPLGAGQYVW